jgi:hypothetical protein
MAEAEPNLRRYRHASPHHASNRRPNRRPDEQPNRSACPTTDERQVRFEAATQGIILTVVRQNVRRCDAGADEQT